MTTIRKLVAIAALGAGLGLAVPSVASAETNQQYLLGQYTNHVPALAPSAIAVATIVINNFCAIVPGYCAATHS